jgi:hypothetical protein
MIEKARFPHCDEKVLHAPGTCEFCDSYPEEQQARIASGTNFTGEGDLNKLPCPAEQRRPLETINRWGGNTPEGHDFAGIVRNAFESSSQPTLIGCVGTTNDVRTEIVSAEDAKSIGHDVYLIYKVSTPIAVKNPRFEPYEDEGAVHWNVEHDGYFAAETLGHEPLEINGQFTDIFHDEIMDALREDLNER